ncbi:MAG: fibronectin type III domain-containing protein, partial [Bacteroidota bacterium]
MKKFLLIFLSALLLLVFQARAQGLDGVAIDTVTNITPDSVTLKGEITTSSEVDVDYYFRYGTTSGDLSDSTESATITALNGTVSVDSVISDLDPETQYFFDLYAEESLDDTKTATSSEVSFWTLSDVYSDAISDFVVDNTSDVSIELSWTASNSDSTDGYMIIYAPGNTAPDPSDFVEKAVLPWEQTLPDPNTDNIDTAIINDDTQVLKLIESLNNGIQYSFSIIPYNSAPADREATMNYNLTTYSTVSAYTLAAEPTADPTNPARDIPDVNEMSITFDEVADADGYLILYATGNNAPDATGVEDGTKSTDGSEFSDADGYQFVQGNSSTNPTITGLVEAEEYSFRIIAFSHTSDEPTTYNYKTPGVELQSVYTLAAEPTGDPTNPKRDTPGGTEMTITYDEVTSASGYLILYAENSSSVDATGVEDGFKSSDGSEFTTADGYQYVQGSNETTPTISGLSEATEYGFRIIPFSHDGENLGGTYNYRLNGTTFSTYTLAAEPDANPTGLTYESKLDESLTISLTEEPTADGYLILYRTGTNGPNTDGVTDGVKHTDAADFNQATGFYYSDGGANTLIEIPNLAPATTYSFNVISYAYATDGLGNEVPNTYKYVTSNNKINDITTTSTIPTTAVSNFGKTSSTSTGMSFSYEEYTGFADDGGTVVYFETGNSVDLSNLENGYQPADQPTIGSDYEIQNDDTATAITVQDGKLLPETKYSFRIVPFNFDGSDYAKLGYYNTNAPTITHYTLSEPASGGDIDPNNFTLNSITNSSMDVNWATVTDADGYLVLYTKSNSALDDSFLENAVSPANQTYPAEIDSINLNDATATSVNVTGLDPDTDYAFKVIPYTYLDDGGPVEETYNYNNDNPPLETATTLCVDPTETVADLATSNVDVDQMDISWTNASGLNVLAVARLSSNAKEVPVDGQDYTANNDFSAANELGTSDNFIVYDGTGTSFTLSGLEDYQEYSIDVYLFNDNGHCYENNGVSVTQQTDCDPASTTVSATSTSAVSFNKLTINWTIEGAGNNVLVVARENSTAAVEPTLNTDYAADPIFGDGDETGTDNFTVYDGNGTSVEVTGLNELTDYSFDIYEYNPANGGFCYNLNDPAETVTETTACEPPSNAAVFNPATNLTAGSVDLSWDAIADAERYLIVAKQGNDADLVVSNGDNYEDGGTGDINSSSFVNATEASGNKIVYANEGTAVTITDLTAATEYTFDIYAYVAGTYCYAYGPDSQTITTLAASANNTLTYGSAATTINAVDNDENGTYITVMDFDMTDGGVDGIATKLASFAFSPGTGNDFTDWTNIIQDAKVVNVTNGNEKLAASITANEIEIAIANSENNGSGKFGYIDDGSTVNMQLQIRLKANITETEIEGNNFVFELDPATITYQGNSSEFLTGAGTEITTAATDNEIEVIATAFEFTANPPATVDAAVDIAQQAVVEAKDANGNLDLNYSGAFTISNADNIPMNNLPTTFNNSELEFPTTFNYQGSGDGTLTISDDNDGFNASSETVTVNPTVDLGELTNGLNTGTLQSATTDQAVLGFALEALGSTQVQAIEFSTNIDLTNRVKNIRLVASADSTYDGTATDAVIASSPAVDNGANTITFSGLTENLSTEAKEYFLVLDVDSTVNEFDTPDLTIGLDIANITFNNSANKNASNFSKTYDFEDITKPGVNQITATPTVLSGKDLGADALEIQVTFNEKMDVSVIPNIEFPVENPTNSLTGPNGNSTWSADSTVYTFYFDLTDKDELVEDVDVFIKDAADKSGNILDDHTDVDLFTIDTENPQTISVNLDKTFITRPDSTLQLEITFNKVMNTAVDPLFAFNGTSEMSNNGDGAWSGGDSVYTLTFDHSLVEEEVNNVNISITNAEDVAGNEMSLVTSPDFNINTTKPRIEFITSPATDGIYNETSGSIEIEVDFDQDVVVSGGVPTLSLNSGGEATHTTTLNDVLTFSYSIGANENAADLDVTAFNLEGASITNTSDNEAELTLPVDPNRLQDNKNIEIDTRSPEVSNITLDLDTVSTTEDILSVTIEYDEDMDQTSSHTFNFSEGNNMLFLSGTWSDARTFDAQFEHDLGVEEELNDVTIEVSGATDVVGNTAVTKDSGPFDIDTQSPRITEILSSTADATYGPGDQINIKVVFDEDIAQSGTAPTLTLNTGATATFDNITNGNELNFNYTIGATGSGENTTDLNVTEISNSENEILDLVDNPSVLTLPASPNNLADNSALVIDTQSPTVSINLDNTEITRANNQLVLTATYDEDMDQGTTPSFNVQGSGNLILDGGSWNSATEYAATFTHNLTEEEIQNVTIEVSGGTDVVGNTAITNTSGNFIIDTQKPSIVEIVSTSANGLYSPGDDINIQLVFDEDVTVGGTPLLDLNTGGQASFQNITNGNEVNFVYTVGGVNSGENTNDLDVTAFDMNGGNIRDLVDNDADVALPADPNRLKDNNNIEIDTQSPEVTSATVDNSIITQADNVLNLIVEYNEDMDQSSTPAFDFNAGSNMVLNAGAWSDARTYSVEFEHDLAVEEELENVSIEISGATDVVGNTTVTDNSDQFDIDTQSPRITEILSSTADATYGPGDQINIKVVFDEDIAQSGTAPTLTLNTGATATFDNITNGNELNFNYTIGATGSGENTTDLNVTEISNSENEILDLVDNPSVLTLPASPNNLADNSALVIDTQSPTVSINLDNTEITRTNNQLVLTATYDEDMDQGTTPSFNVQGSGNLILDGGSWNSATEYAATFTHNLTEEEIQNVTIEVSGGTDVVGNTAITNTSGSFIIDTQKPRIVEIVSTSANGLYSPGDDINIQLVFDEDVAVGGTPLLDLNTGGQASFQNITNGNEVNFVYTVGGVNSGENTNDLD